MYATTLVVTLLWLLMMIFTHVVQEVFESDLLSHGSVVTLNAIAPLSMWGFRRGFAKGPCRGLSLGTRRAGTTEGGG